MLQPESRNIRCSSQGQDHIPSVGEPLSCSNHVLGWVSPPASPSCGKCERAQVWLSVGEPPPQSPSNIFLVTSTLSFSPFLPLRMLNNEVGFTLESRPGPGIDLPTRPPSDAGQPPLAACSPGATCSQPRWNATATHMPLPRPQATRHRPGH